MGEKNGDDKKKRFRTGLYTPRTLYGSSEIPHDYFAAGRVDAIYLCTKLNPKSLLSKDLIGKGHCHRSLHR